MFSNISMIGLGYIGLPTATLFAARKIHVLGIDVSEHVVNTINQGKIHIVEPELDMLVQAAVSGGYLRASLKPEPAEVFLIAVPTPFTEGHKPDLSFVRSAALAIAPVLKPGDLVILESTSPVGTTEKLAKWLAEARGDLTFPQQVGEEADIQIAYCPERVLPGRVVHELVENDRVIGGMTKAATKMAQDLYRVVVKGELIATNARTAEMCKLTENSFRDVNIAFANELSVLCDQLDINVWELISLANRHPRVNVLQPGAGVGGHCIAVDPWFIVDSCPKDARLIEMARLVNDGKPEWIVNKAKLAIADVLATHPERAMRSVKVACLGLAFKPNIDDLRESPALGIVETIGQLGCQVFAVEPHIENLPRNLASLEISLFETEEAVRVADVVLVLVKHSAFIEYLPLLRAKSTVIDVVGLLE